MPDNQIVVQMALVEIGVLAQDITPQALLQDDLAIDSTELIEVIAVIEKQTGLQLDEKNMKQIRTVEELIAFVNNQQHQQQ